MFGRVFQGLGKTTFLFFFLSLKESFHFVLGDLMVGASNALELLFALSCLFGSWASTLMCANPIGCSLNLIPGNKSIVVGIEMAE